METQAWSSFWTGRGAGEAAVHSQSRGRSYEAFWREVGAQFVFSRPGCRHIDLACGSGVVSQAILSACPDGERAATLYFADIAQEAVRMTGEGLGSATGAVAHGKALPFADGAFDVVTSQYGLEYAGLDALMEAVRVLAPGGTLIALIHIKDGPIARECTDNLTCLRHAIDAGVLEIVAQGLEGETKGVGDALAQETRWQSGAVSCPARDFVLRMLGDAGTLWTRRDAYHRDDARHWIGHQTRELADYAARMGSMIRASRTQGEILARLAQLEDGVLARLSLGGFTLDGEEAASAWHLALRKAG